MRFNWICFCSLTAERTIEIRDGAVVAGGLPDGPDGLADSETIEGLLTLIQTALDEDAAAINVTYHPTLGYPLEAHIDYDLRTIDEELGFTIHQLTLR